MLTILRSREALRDRLDKRRKLLLEETENVDRIVTQVRTMGDEGLKELTRRYDGVSLSEIRVSTEHMEKAKDRLNATLRSTLSLAARNVHRFHVNQVPDGFQFSQPDGTKVRLAWRPVSRVGVYVPGGKFPLVSTVIMSVVPAQVAGAKEIAVCTPPGHDGVPHESILATCAILGIGEVYAIGGAQAIAAMAVGTETVPRVDKIAGPGNVYVTAAKQAVSAMVGIDMAAGPTELVVLADETANPDFVAADLISQAEHDPLAWPVLVTPSRTTADVVNRRIENMVQKVATRDISRKSLTSQGFIYLADSEEACIQVANEIAPEHLSLQISNPRRWVEHLTAGAIFVGSLTPVAWGDYWAGANHILPTLGQARFRGPLSVLDFLVPYTIVEVPCQAINLSGDKVRLLARTEGLEAHALSVQLRETGA